MIHCEEYSAQAMYVGADQQLGAQLRATIESKPGWAFHQVVDVETSVAIQSELPTTATILYISDSFSFTQSLKFLSRTDRSETPTVVIYDQLEPKQLLELFKAGAVECLGRPVNLTRLSLVLDMLIVPGNSTSSKTSKGETTLVETSGQRQDSPAWQEKLMDQVHAVASLSTTVLITGETGTGKTRLSRLIHGLSDRRDKPFLAVNCGALSESLLDSELFGHVKGAFTGADNDYEGKLAQCKDGTLLLDEIDMLSPAAQVKLLQVVEDRVFQPVGSPEVCPLQARLIVASNRPLEQQVEEGNFRSDLFYRLNVMAFRLPPLRDRRDEIRPLIEKFVGEFTNQHGFEKRSDFISPHAQSAMQSYSWPGNIRELRNIVERAVILSAGQQIEVTHLPSHVVEAACSGGALPQSTPTTGPSKSHGRATKGSKNKLEAARSEAERVQLLDALERNDNNRSKTAIYLGISRVALYKRLRKLHIL